MRFLSILILIVTCKDFKKIIIIHKQKDPSEKIIETRVFCDLYNVITDNFDQFLLQIQSKKGGKKVKYLDFASEIIMAYYKYFHLLMKNNNYIEHVTIENLIKYNCTKDQMRCSSNLNNVITIHEQLTVELQTTTEIEYKNIISRKNLKKYFKIHYIEREDLIGCINRIIANDFKTLNLTHTLFTFYYKNEEKKIINMFDTKKEKTTINVIKFIDVFHDKYLINILRYEFRELRTKNIEICIKLEVNEYILDLYEHICINTCDVMENIIQEKISQYFENIYLFINTYKELMSANNLYSENCNIKLNFAWNIKETLNYLQCYLVIRGNQTSQHKNTNLTKFLSFHTKCCNVLVNLVIKYSNLFQKPAQQINGKLIPDFNLIDILKLKYVKHKKQNG